MVISESKVDHVADDIVSAAVRQAEAELARTRARAAALVGVIRSYAESPEDRAPFQRQQAEPLAQREAGCRRSPRRRASRMSETGVVRPQVAAAGIPHLDDVRVSSASRREQKGRGRSRERFGRLESCTLPRRFLHSITPDTRSSVSGRVGLRLD